METRAGRIIGSRGWGDFSIGADFINPEEERVLRCISKDANLALTRLRKWHRRSIASFYVTDFPFVEGLCLSLPYLKIKNKLMINVNQLRTCYPRLLVSGKMFVTIYNILFKLDTNRTDGLGLIGFCKSNGIEADTACLILLLYYSLDPLYSELVELIDMVAKESKQSVGTLNDVIEILQKK